MSEAGERHLPPWLTVSTDPAPPADALVVSGTENRSRAGLFTDWATALSFPDYFGHNWDALLDCLRDLVTRGPRTLVVTDAADLLADEPPAQLATLLAVLASAAQESDQGLRVVLHTPTATAPVLHRRLAAALH
ncbi:barstar (barnase inhibitor) [Micromonospora pisi]|uniref:Barstar (Barnase inhibitor) n=1 Tax=Micromonospora pisi TaxID=589240 RepID=A0A495JN81_9ACTN|nr:barstar family protein [Micromonospora pisi]RKR89824.1 barstar (barnase inhibitor) [Micromonospora pisi]